MNKLDMEVAAIEKRVKAAKEYEEFRKKHLKDAYNCYLAYMNLRFKERECN